MYNAATEEILVLGSNSKNKRQSEENNQAIFYVDNIFKELNDIYLKKKEVCCYEYDVHDNIILHAVTIFLRDIVDDYRTKNTGVNGLHTSYYFAFFLPTNWDDEIREELIRPLFIRAGLITENDHSSRLLFFTQLELNFRLFQTIVAVGCNQIATEIKHGKQYIMYGLIFTETKFLVNLDLFSAHYPPTIMKDIHVYCTKSLKSNYFATSLDSNIESGIEACLKIRGFNTEAVPTRKMLHKLIKHYHNEEVIKFVLFY